MIERVVRAVELQFCRLALLAAATTLAGACHSSTATPPGVLIVGFVPRPAQVSALTVASATLTVNHVSPIGDKPPDQPPPPMRRTIDVTSSEGVTLEFDEAPPGVYSQVQFSTEGASVSGSWRGTPLTVTIATFGGHPIDVRSPTGHTLGPGVDATLMVDIDVAQWFANTILDQATVTDGTIVCDQDSNSAVTNLLSMQLDGSFTLE